MPSYMIHCKKYVSDWVAHFISKGCSERKALGLALRRSTPIYRKPSIKGGDGSEV
jgi:hypothetical protein